MSWHSKLDRQKTMLGENVSNQRNSEALLHNIISPCILLFFSIYVLSEFEKCRQEN